MLNPEWIGAKPIGGGRLAAGAVAAVLMVVGASVAARAEPLTIGYATWVGYGPLFVAQEKGFLADQGLEVTTVRTEETGFPALVDGQIDVIADTLDAAAVWVEEANFEDRPLCVLALDDSIGGDGIVATNDIRKVDDLAGKTVAFPELTVSQFYLNVLLHETGLRAGDIEPVLMTSEDAADAFMLGDIDAAVVWEPWLSQAANTAHGHLLADSSERPGLIVDCLVTRASTLERRKSDFQALARAWAAGVDYYNAHPEEAVAIMARHVGGWLEDPAVFAETLEGVRFYDRERNKAYFGTPERPGAIYDTAQKAIDVWSSLGRVEADISPADLIGHGVWDE